MFGGLDGKRGRERARAERGGQLLGFTTWMPTPRKEPTSFSTGDLVQDNLVRKGGKTCEKKLGDLNGSTATTQGPHKRD